MNIDSFYKVAKQYKAIFFDSFGVLKSYGGVIEGAEDTFKMLLNEGIYYIVLTNDSSKSPALLAKNFKKLGFKNIPEHKIVSSGMLTRAYLESKIVSGRIAYVGTKSSAKYIAEIGFEMVPIDEIIFLPGELDKIKALVFLDDEGFDWRKGLNNAVNLLRLRNIPVVVANTDLMYPLGNDSISIATGGVADLVEKVVGKNFLRFGKPDVQIFGYAFEHICPEGTLDKSDILMVGDTLTTDIIGANKFGIDTALVLTGNTIPDQSDFLIKSSGIIPNYICDSISID